MIFMIFIQIFVILTTWGGKDLNAVAKDWDLSYEEGRKVLEAAGAAKRETTDRAKGESRPKQEEALKRVADMYDLSIKAADKALAVARDGAARETTRPHPKGNGDDLDLTPAQAIAHAKAELAQRKYEKLFQLSKAKLPPGRLKTRKQAQLASNLWKTFNTAQDRREDAGLAPLDTPPEVADAHSRSVAFYRKNAHPTRATKRPSHASKSTAALT